MVEHVYDWQRMHISSLRTWRCVCSCAGRHSRKAGFGSARADPKTLQKHTATPGPQTPPKTHPLPSTPAASPARAWMTA